MIKTTLAAAMAACVLASAAMDVRAQTFTTQASGSWASFAGKANNGRPLCGMKTWNGQTGATVMIKYFGGLGGALEIQATKPAWRFRADTVTRADVFFDSAWFGGTDKAETENAPFGGMVSFVIPNTMTENFLNEFAAADKMRLQMGGVTWTADMVGSRNAADAFKKCMVPLLAIELNQGQQQPRAQAPQPQTQPQTQPAPAPAKRKPGERDA